MSALHLREDVVASNIHMVKDFRDAVEAWYLPGYDIHALSRAAPDYIKRYPAMRENQNAYKEVDSLGAIIALGQTLPDLLGLKFGGMDEDPASDFPDFTAWKRIWGRASTSLNSYGCVRW